MLEALLLSLSCVLTTDLVEYKDGCYQSEKRIECPANAFVKTPRVLKGEVNDRVKVAELTLTPDGNKLHIYSHVVVDRPWIAPVPIFMGIAKGKHADELAKGLDRILVKGEAK